MRNFIIHIGVGRTGIFILLDTLLNLISLLLKEPISCFLNEKDLSTPSGESKSNSKATVMSGLSSNSNDKSNNSSAFRSNQYTPCISSLSLIQYVTQLCSQRILIIKKSEEILTVARIAQKIVSHIINVQQQSTSVGNHD